MKKLLFAVAVLVTFKGVVFATTFINHTQADVSTEVSNRVAGDTAIGITTGTLRTDLNTEITNRANGDSTIGITTGTLRTDLSTETTNRQDGDAAIGVTTGTLRTDLNTETTNRQNGDSDIGVTTGTLRTDLNSSISAIGVTTGTLRTDLTTETSNRTTGDNNIGVSTGNIVTSLTDYSQIAATETYTAQKTFSNMVTVSSTAYINGSLGVGIIDPLKKAHIFGVASGVTPFADTQLFIENADGGGMELATAAGGASYIRFSTPTFVGGFIGFSAGVSPSKMYFGSGGATQMTLDGAGNVYINNDCSALSFTDRTEYPKTKAEAYEAVNSMELNADGKGLDHTKLSNFIRVEKEKDVYDKDKKVIGKTTELGRNLTATVSSLNEVVKDLIKRIEVLELKK